MAKFGVRQQAGRHLTSRFGSNDLADNIFGIFLCAFFAFILFMGIDFLMGDWEPPTRVTVLNAVSYYDEDECTTTIKISALNDQQETIRVECSPSEWADQRNKNSILVRRRISNSMELKGMYHPLPDAEQ